MRRRAKRALASRPTPRDILEFFAAAILFGAIAGSVSAATGLLAISPRSLGEIPGIAVLALIVPAFAEELIFRGLLIPVRTEAPRAVSWIAFSTALFVLWHCVETLWLPHAAPIFLRADFLILAGMLGLICAVLRRRSGSIWTAQLLHWSAAVIWIGYLGGPTLSELR